MLRLAGYELWKILGVRSFRLSVCVLLSLNLFLLWYANLPGEDTPPLAAYRAFGRETAGMTEEETGEYILSLKETVDGILFVQKVLGMRSLSGEMGEVLAAGAMEENPGKFEAYYELYQSGEYCRLTDSLWKESALIEELYGEWSRVTGYGDYLRSVQEKRNMLSAVGIFGGGEENSFAARNIQKSAGDYGRLTESGVRWMPSKALSGAMESVWTDLFLLVSVFFFVGRLTMEEKEKGLFYITRATKNGLVPGILGKYAALGIYCSAAVLLLYGINFGFYEWNVGFWDPGAALQSVAPYMESSLDITVWQYILISLFTKAFVLFGFGAVLTALSIRAERIYLPYLAGIVFCGGSYILYTTIPAASVGVLFKYLNLMGMLKTESLYGAYLNFNLFGQPVSRTAVIWAAALGLAGCAAAAGTFLFVRGGHLEFRPGILCRKRLFRPHSCLLRHEGYKIMVMNRAGLVLLFFAVLAGYREWNHSYGLSVQEEYYQDIMLRLEGELTQEKEALILAEQDRYEEAFAQIQRIEEMILAGVIDEGTGEDLKSELSAVTAFYPSFCRVLQQYERIRTEGGVFLYDTGYRYLLGCMNEEYLINLLLFSCGMILAFGNVIAMEDRNGSWALLSATRKGKRRILACKTVLCVTAAALLPPAVFACRAIRLFGIYPLHGLTASIRSIPLWQDFWADLPVWGFCALFVLSQAAAHILVTLAVLLLSWRRKDAFQVYFLGALLFVVPLVLKILGFSFAGWFSVYPLYSGYLSRHGIF